MAATFGARSLLTGPAAVARQDRDHFDAVSVLTMYVLTLFLIPAPMKLAALGSAGHPATILSLVAFAWWCWYRVQRPFVVREPVQPVRAGIALFLVVLLATYAHAMIQPIAADEISPADSGMLRVLGFVGLVLVAIDGMDSRDRTWVLARRLSLVMGGVALLAIIQSVTGQLWIDRISIPGLTSAAGAIDLATRGGLVRPSGTATHNIEFGAVLSMTLPVVVTLARHTRTPLRFWVIAGLIAFATLVSLSRTALITAAVGMLAFFPVLPRSARIAGMIGGVLLTAVAFVTMPGLSGTIRGMFVGAGEDPSVQSRTNSYAIAGEFISSSPWFGHGFGTFLPRYWILDNLYLLLMIEIGFVGLAAMLGAVGAAIWSGRWVARNAATQADRELGQSAMGGLLAGSVALLFFDAFSFPQSAGLYFLLIGLLGALYRQSKGFVVEPLPDPDTGPADPAAAASGHSETGVPRARR